MKEKEEKADFLCKKLKAIPITSTTFDSLLQEVYALPPHLQIPILLDVGCRDAVHPLIFEKQKNILIRVLSFAPKREKKRALRQLIEIYQKLDQNELQIASIEGLKLCDDLLDNYPLSQSEVWSIKRQKVLFFNKQKLYKEGILILYDLLEQHHNNGITVDVIEDLYAIAGYFFRLGDYEKSLLTYKEVYQLSVDNQLAKYQNLSFVSIIRISYNMGLYSDIIDICSKLHIDSIAEKNPTIYPLLSISYLNEFEVEKARFYLTKMSQQSYAGSGIVFCCRMAETYIKEEKEDSATMFLNRAIKQVATINSLHSLNKVELPLYFMYVYPSYASLLHKNGKIKQADEAFQLVEPLMKAPVSEPERWEKQIDALNRYSNFCLSTKQYKKATELLVFRDSIQKVYYENKISLDAKNWTGRFEIQELTFDNEKKQEEINNTKRISSIIATVSFILFGFTVVTVCMYRYIRKQNKKLRENQAQMALLLNPKPVVVKKREPLTPQEQLLELASKTVKSQKLFLNSKLTLDELAEILDTNRSTLSACINQCAKCNFNKWINNYRIDYIKKRITATSNSRDLCTEAGFNSINTFTNSFKERLGCTPGEYIDRCKYETLQEDTQ